MEPKVVILILVVVYWVMKSFFGKDATKNAVPPVNNKPSRPKSPNSKPTSQKSVEDIFKEFVKEVENKNRPSTPPKPAIFPKRSVGQKQEVRTTKILPKKQLIYHEDYHDTHGEIRDISTLSTIEDIAETEGAVYQFDKDKIDWKQAIITKEILDTKYA